MVTFKNSAVLSFGRRPKLKTAEFLKVTILYHEILRCENLDFGCECYTYWDPDPEGAQPFGFEPQPFPDLEQILRRVP